MLDNIVEYNNERFYISNSPITTYIKYDNLKFYVHNTHIPFDVLNILINYTEPYENKGELYFYEVSGSNRYNEHKKSAVSHIVIISKWSKKVCGSHLEIVNDCNYYLKANGNWYYTVKANDWVGFVIDTILDNRYELSVILKSFKS